VRHDVTVVVGVPRAILDDSPQYATDELDVGCESSEWPEDCGNAQLGVVEALAEHLDLYDAVQLTAREASLDVLFFILIHLTVDEVRLEASRVVHGRNVPGMIHAAGDRNQLMCGSGLAKQLKLFEAVVDNGLVAWF
jgi:hypothetical protein